MPCWWYIGRAGGGDDEDGAHRTLSKCESTCDAELDVTQQWTQVTAPISRGDKRFKEGKSLVMSTD